MVLPFGFSSVGSLVQNFLARRRPSSNPAEFRLLGNICGFIEVYSFKNAIAVCNKEIKRQPDQFVVLALKAIAISQSSNPITAAQHQEILNIVQQIKSRSNGAGLGDADVVYLVTWVLTFLNQPKEATAILAEATQKFPANEETFVEAFYHSIRVGEFLTAQQNGMKMQRQFNDPKYFWWTIMSIVLQIRNEKNATNDLLLSLVERQLITYYQNRQAVISLGDEAVDKGKGNKVDQLLDSNEPTPVKTPAFESVHEFHVVSRVLELRARQQQRKSAGDTNGSKALVRLKVELSDVLPSTTGTKPLDSAVGLLVAHLESPEAVKWCGGSLGLELWRREMEWRYGEKITWNLSSQRMIRLLKEGDFNWHTMLYTIRVKFAYLDTFAESALSQEQIESLTSLYTIFLELDKGKIKIERGYLLAQLEIALECRRRKWKNEFSNLAELCQQYLRRFGGKNCCFDDLLPYLEVLESEERLEIRSKIVEESSINSEGATIAQALDAINREKVSRYLSINLNEQVDVELSIQYMNQYFQTLSLGANLPATDLQYADDFALLSAQALVNAWESSRDRRHLERAIVLLEFAAARSKYKYQIRILLVNLHQLFGAFSAAFGHFRLLGIKSVQHDTLSHPVMNRGSTFSMVASTDASILDEAEIAGRWYQSSIIEASEMVVRVFGNANYSQVEDFVEFRERLDKSLSKRLLYTETLRMRTMRGLLDSDRLSAALEDISDLLGSDITTLSDNRDFTTLPNFQPAGRSTIWDQTSMGPRTNGLSLKTFAYIYTTLLSSGKTNMIELDELSRNVLTGSEVALFDFSNDAKKVLMSSMDENGPEENALQFFKGQDRLLLDFNEDSTKLPWELLHIAMISLEAYCLLDTAVDRRISKMQGEKIQDHYKIAKRLKAFRLSARDALRAIGSRITTIAKQVAKSKSKTLANVKDLNQFVLLNDDRLQAFAQSFTESRKAVVEGIGAAIHARCR